MIGFTLPDSWEAQSEILFRIKNVSILATLPDEGDLGGATVRIRWTGLADDDQTGESDWQRFTVDSFEQLSSDALFYIAKLAPRLIPAFIVDLAPGDTLSAIGEFEKLRRDRGAGKASSLYANEVERIGFYERPPSPLEV